MSETSISTSPSKSDCTVYATRLKRRSKRSKINLPLQINSDQEVNPDFFRNLLTDFYQDSEDEPTETAAPESKSKSLLKNAAILRNFKPFEVEKSLVMADHIFHQQLSQSKENSFPETQEFATRTNLSETKNKSQIGSINNLSEKHSQNDSFIITESELISCCHQAEQILENNDANEQDSTLHELTPKKKDYMILVNSILEDFSQSPLSKDQVITNVPCQCTPEFRLRLIPIKNYSRKHIKCRRINLAQRFEEPETKHSSEYDENISCCSSLSVQEDDTFCENSHNQTIATTLNNTERLCENLVSLTEYFTQNELKQSLEESQESKNKHSAEKNNDDIVSNLNKISDLCENIFSLRSKQSNDLHNVSYDSSDDFNGFANSECKIDNHFGEQSASDVNIGGFRNSNNLKEKKDNTFLDDWDEDDSHDVFACINTENVLQQYNIHIPNNKGYNFDDFTAKFTNEKPTFEATAFNSAYDSCISSKADLLKPIQVSKEDNRMAVKKLANFSDIPDFTEKDPTLNCDNKILDKGENIFENPEDYEWNDDCDLFLNFHTPISSKENNVTKTQQQISILPAFSHFEQDVPTTSKLATLGFTTAAGKNVHISSKGQAVVQKLLNEFAGEINNSTNYEEQLKEMKSKVYAKSHNLKTEPTSLSVKKPLNTNHKLQNAQHAQCSKNFHTEQQISPITSIVEEYPDILELKQQTSKTFNLKSKSSEMSTKTQNSGKKLLKESADIPAEECSTHIECIEDAINTKGSQHNNVNTINPLLPQKDHKQMEHLGMGFQTANVKEISVSRKAKQVVETLLKDFNADVDIEQDLKDIKTNVHVKNKDLKPKSNHYTKNDKEGSAEVQLTNQCNMQRNQLNTNVNKGFQTANGKEISISAKAKQTVETLLREFNNDLDVETCEKDLKDLKAKLLNKNKSEEDFVRKNVNEKCQLDEPSSKLSLHEIKNITMNDLNTNIDVGFQTANGKHVHISAKAKQAVGDLLKDLNTIVDVETSEKYLNDAKTKIQNKNKDLQAQSLSQTLIETSATLLKLGDQWPSKLTNCKRKISIDNSDLETLNKTPAVKVFKTDLQSSPLTSATRSITIRKNLLSLTKKRKKKGSALIKPTEEIAEINNDLNGLNGCTSTPIKSYAPIETKEPAPETPNLKEFLTNASLTSTPRITKPQSAAQTLEDSDLNPILWKNDSSFCNKSDNNSLYNTKLSESSTSNISFNSPNPTAKERIGRLKMYGKAPDVSPILIETNHNCRPSGLRRTRSMLKKTEN